MQVLRWYRNTYYFPWYVSCSGTNTVYRHSYRRTCGGDCGGAALENDVIADDPE